VTAVIKNGTVATADRRWGVDVLFHSAIVAPKVFG
jgi:hypothetical protein